MFRLSIVCTLFVAYVSAIPILSTSDQTVDASNLVAQSKLFKRQQNTPVSSISGLTNFVPGAGSSSNLAGDAIDTLLHTLGGSLGNTETNGEYLGIAAANAAPAARDTINAIQTNNGILGDAAKVVGGQ